MIKITYAAEPKFESDFKLFLLSQSHSHSHTWVWLAVPRRPSTATCLIAYSKSIEKQQDATLGLGCPSTPDQSFEFEIHVEKRISYIFHQKIKWFTTTCFIYNPLGFLNDFSYSPTHQYVGFHHRSMTLETSTCPSSTKLGPIGTVAAVYHPSEWRCPLEVLCSHRQGRRREREVWCRNKTCRDVEFVLVVILLLLLLISTH